MDSTIRQALENDRVVDITTVGAKSGEARRIEIWIHAVGDRFIITGQPGGRDWYANLLANPSFTVHVKESATADLVAEARAVTDAGEKERLLRAAPALATYVTDESIADWVARSPVVEVVFTGDA